MPQSPHGRFGEQKNLLLLLGFKPLTIQPVATIPSTQSLLPQPVEGLGIKHRHEAQILKGTEVFFHSHAQNSPRTY
jgi:hypothetical protein